MRNSMSIGLGSQRPGFSPTALFSAGQAGDVWINSRSYYFTDTAGTTPVTTTGDLVAAWRGARHGTLFTQATDTSRPTFQSESGVDFLLTDGGDFMSTPAIDFSASDAISAFVGVRKLSDAAQSMFLELGIGASNGKFDIQAPPFATAGYSAGSRGSAAVTAQVTTGFAAPVSSVVSIISDISSDSLDLWVNNSVAATATGDQGTGNFGNYALSVGARSNGTLPATVRIGPVIVRSGPITAAQALSTRAWVARAFGVTF
jgi:hypothetical protein